MDWCEYKPFERGDTLSTWKLVDPVYQERILKQIRSWWNVSPESKYFPGPQPVSIERKDLPLLFSKDYWVCAKSDGLRFLLVFVQINNKNLCLLVNRKNDMYLVKTRVWKSAFVGGTVLDGELVCDKDTGKLEYLVYDATVVSGTSAVKLTHSQRMDMALRMVEFVREPSVCVRVKEFYPVSDMRSYVERVTPTMNHGVDGYVFTPEHHSVCSGTHFAMFKWKEQFENTVDFHVSKDLRQLRIAKGKMLMEVVEARNMLVFPDKVLEREVRKLAPCIVECRATKDKKWCAVLVRKDKTYPNNYLTYSKTLLNIQENIQLDEFLKVDEMRYKMF